MQKLTDIQKWQRVEAGKALAFENPEPRRVRLDVNAPGWARLSYADGNGLITFLALVRGRDVIEFKAYGEFSLVVEDNDCWVYTIDGEEIFHSAPDSESFTKLVERRPRNHEVELMNYLMRENMNRIVQEQTLELEKLWDKRERAAEARAAKLAAASDDGGPADQSAPAEPSGGDGRAQSAAAGNKAAKGD